MNPVTVFPRVRAIHHEGMLRLLDPLKLPEGAQVNLYIQLATPEVQDKTHSMTFAYPARLVPADKLDNLTALL